MDMAGRVGKGLMCWKGFEGLGGRSIFLNLDNVVSPFVLLADL
jgi:hypothetical protein